MRENLVREELEDGQEETQPRTNRRPSATDRSGNCQRKTYPPGLPRSRHQRTELLPLAQGVWRPEAGAGATAEGTGERVVAGEASLEGRGLGKLLSPERRRCAVEHAHQQWVFRAACLPAVGAV